jgi:uncharacterized protein
MFQKGCTLGSPKACHELARLYFAGTGVPRDPKKGVELLEQGCKGTIDINGQPDPTACVQLGFELQEGKNVTKDPDRAFALLKKACDDGNALGCVGVGWAHEKGLGTPANRDIAVTFYERGCDNRAGVGCFYASNLYKQKDPEKARVLREKACQLKHQIACSP